MDSHCHDDVIIFYSILKNILRIFLDARYRAVDIVTRVTRALRSKRYQKPTSTRNKPTVECVLVFT
jgi:hypothetical protein